MKWLGFLFIITIICVFVFGGIGFYGVLECGYCYCYRSTDGQYFAEILGEKIYYSEDHDETAEYKIIELAAGYDIDKILYAYGAVAFFEENFNGYKIMYAYSPVLHNTVWIKNKPINLQIISSENGVTVANPLNFGTF